MLLHRVLIYKLITRLESLLTVSYNRISVSIMFLRCSHVFWKTKAVFVLTFAVLG